MRAGLLRCPATRLPACTPGRLGCLLPILFGWMDHSPPSTGAPPGPGPPHRCDPLNHLKWNQAMRESASAQGHNPDSFDMLLYEYPYLGSKAATSQCPALFYGLGNLRKTCSNAGGFVLPRGRCGTGSCQHCSPAPCTLHVRLPQLVPPPCPAALRRRQRAVLQRQRKPQPACGATRGKEERGPQESARPAGWACAVCACARVHPPSP